MSYTATMPIVNPNVSPAFRRLTPEPSLQYHKSPPRSEFEVERTQKQNHPSSRRISRQPTPDLDSERGLQTSVDALLKSKARPFAVSGSLALDLSSVVLFFNSKVHVVTGVNHHV